MTRRQENKLSMYLAVIAVLATFKEIWQSIAILQSIVAEFERLVQLLQKAVKKQAEKRKGISVDKQSSRRMMADQAVIVAGVIRAYANATNNHQLEESVNYSLTDFTRNKDTLAKEYAEIIFDKATEHELPLAEYGLTQDDIDTLDNCIDEYADLISSPRVGVTNRKESTGSIRQLLDKIDNLLKKQIDSLLLRHKNTEFYTTYKAARVIVDLRGKKRKSDPDSKKDKPSKDTAE